MAVPVESHTVTQLRALAAALPSRDGLLVRLVCTEGLTLNEALRLQVGDITNVAVVTTKAGTRRTHALPNDVRQLARDVSGDRREGPLFVAASGAPLRNDQARQVILASFEEVGIMGESLHALRARLLAA